MRQLIRFVISIVSATAAGIGGEACAEVPDMPPARMHEIASHIFTGKIARIYSSVDRSTPGWETTHGVAEFRILRVEKGKHESALAYVRFWNKRFTGTGAAPPGAYGHRGVPKVGVAARVYVVTAEDGGLDVLPPNGLAALSAVEAQK